MIKVVNLKKQFGDNVVLKDISVTVTPGEAISVIGPSGSGKSTFLRCINGLEEITDGHIYVDELDIADPNLNIDKLTIHSVLLKSTHISFYCSRYNL